MFVTGVVHSLRDGTVHLWNGDLFFLERFQFGNNTPTVTNSPSGAVTSSSSSTAQTASPWKGQVVNTPPPSSPPVVISPATMNSVASFFNNPFSNQTQPGSTTLPEAFKIVPTNSTPFNYVPHTMEPASPSTNTVPTSSAFLDPYNGKSNTTEPEIVTATEVTGESSNSKMQPQNLLHAITTHCGNPGTNASAVPDHLTHMSNSCQPDNGATAFFPQHENDTDDELTPVLRSKRRRSKN